MAVSGIGKMTAKAAGSAAGKLGELIGSGVYPETEYALAAYLYRATWVAAMQGECLGRAVDRLLHQGAREQNAPACLRHPCAHQVCGKAVGAFAHAQVFKQP